MPYSSPARTSRVCGIMYMKRGSGLVPNGLFWRPKNFLYMAHPPMFARGGFADLRRRLNQLPLGAAGVLAAELRAMMPSVGSLVKAHTSRSERSDLSRYSR